MLSYLVHVVTVVIALVAAAFMWRSAPAPRDHPGYCVDEVLSADFGMTMFALCRTIFMERRA